MKNVMVTGGCGFIGSNFIRYLLESDDFTGRIVNVDKLTYAGNPENLSGIPEAFGERYVFVREDICDLARMKKVFDRYEIDAVCHLAAESHVDRSIVAPDAFVRSNVMGTFNLLELVRRWPGQIQRFHHVSTDEVFGSLGEDGYFLETTAYRPNSPYSASKAASDHLVRAYFKTYGLPVTISNCSNNYGPFQFPEKLIPLMILNALEQKPLPVYGDGKHVRDWLYVKDHCNALWTVMKHGEIGETYNIGGSNELENIALVRMICDIMEELKSTGGGGSYRNLIVHVKDRPGHDRRYAIDHAKITGTLGWEPSETFETGIRKTIAWYLENTWWTDRVRSGEYKEWIRRHYS